VSNAIAEILEKAADLIATGHLVKGMLWDEEGGYCSVGAVRAVIQPELVGVDMFPLVQRAVAALYEHGLSADYKAQPPPWPSGNWERVVEWNNAPERTADEVIEAMRQAAKHLHNEAVPA